MDLLFLLKAKKILGKRDEEFSRKKKKIKIERRNYSNEERRNYQKKKFQKKEETVPKRKIEFVRNKERKIISKKKVEIIRKKKRGIVRKTKGDIFLIKIKEKLPRQIYFIKLRNGDTV